MNLPNGLELLFLPFLFRNGDAEYMRRLDRSSRRRFLLLKRMQLVQRLSFHRRSTVVVTNLVFISRLLCLDLRKPSPPLAIKTELSVPHSVRHLYPAISKTITFINNESFEKLEANLGSSQNDSDLIFFFSVCMYM